MAWVGCDLKVHLVLNALQWTGAPFTGAGCPDVHPTGPYIFPLMDVWASTTSLGISYLYIGTSSEPSSKEASLSSCVDRIHHPQTADLQECHGITVFITAGRVLEAAHQYKNEELQFQYQTCLLTFSHYNYFGSVLPLV